MNLIILPIQNNLIAPPVAIDPFTAFLQQRYETYRQWAALASPEMAAPRSLAKYKAIIDADTFMIVPRVNRRDIP